MTRTHLSSLCGLDTACRIALSFLSLTVFAAPVCAFDPWKDTALYEFTYTTDVSGLVGERVNLWLPLPSESDAQQVLSESIRGPGEPLLTRDGRGNRYAHFSWSGAPAEATVEMKFRTRRSPDRGASAEEAVTSQSLDPELYAGPQKRIPLDGVIAALGAQEARGHETDGEKIRAFYDYVVRNMKYSKKGEGWGNGDAVWACTSRYGNCTDFHSVFIGMARSQGIPARFVIGFPLTSKETSADVDGYHCWSEAFDRERGWIPVDASEAYKAGKPDAFYGTLPSDRIAFSIGRDLVLEPSQEGAPRNYFIYPYAEVDGTAVEKVPAHFHFRRTEGLAASRRP